MTTKMIISKFALTALGAAFAATGALAASPELVQATTNAATGQTLLMFTGGVSGPTAELFSILDKSAGGVVHRFIEGSTIAGRDITASQLYLNGDRFTAQITLDSTTSSYNQTGDDLNLMGAVAEEIYTDMTKAELPTKRGVDTTSVSGKLITCSILFIGHEVYSCQFSGISQR